MIFLLVLFCSLLYSKSYHTSLYMFCNIFLGFFQLPFFFGVCISCMYKQVAFHRNACLVVHVTSVFALLVALPVLHAPFTNLFMCISRLCTSSQEFLKFKF